MIKYIQVHISGVPSIIFLNQIETARISRSTSGPNKTDLYFTSGREVTVDEPPGVVLGLIDTELTS